MSCWKEQRSDPSSCRTRHTRMDQYRGFSLIRNTHLPEDHHRSLGMPCWNEQRSDPSSCRTEQIRPAVY